MKLNCQVVSCLMETHITWVVLFCSWCCIPLPNSGFVLDRQELQDESSTSVAASLFVSGRTGNILLSPLKGLVLVTIINAAFFQNYTLD